MGYPRVRKVLLKRLEKTLMLAWDPRRKRHVVIKRFSNKARFRREASAMASYGDNPHLVRLLQVFRTKRFLYLVMEYARGPTLKKLIRQRGTLGWRKSLALTLNILEGVNALHQRGFIHGDLHSGNVLVTNLKRAAVKIIDLEHAVKKGKSGKAKASRRLSSVPSNLAPESRTGIIDETYDIYGVGCMCAEMLRGSPGRKPRRKPSNAAEAALWKVIRKAMHPKPRKRYQSAEEMMMALNEVRALQKPKPLQETGLPGAPLPKEPEMQEVQEMPESSPGDGGWPDYWQEPPNPDTEAPPAWPGRWERNRAWPSRGSTTEYELPGAGSGL